MSEQKQKYYADSMAFLALQGQPPVFDSSKRPQLQLAHLTSVLPFVKDFDAALDAHRTFREQALSNNDVHEIRTCNDVARTGSLGLVFGMQHTPPHMTRERLLQLHHAGVRVMQLAYNGPSDYGGGFTSIIGLTESGKELLEWMAEVGMILDLSHANQKTAYMALNFIQKEKLPLKPMTSHTGAASIFPHQRNMDSDAMEGVAATSGYIGILLINFYLGKQYTDGLKNFLRHVTRTITTVGSEAVGIGSDCPHIGQTMVQAKQQYINMTRTLETGGTFGEYFPDRPIPIIKNGRTVFDILYEKLTSVTPFGAEGFSERVVDNLCGGNFKSYLERSLPRA
jgi:microsomal dipeptidase-like Zn-dependent dipeptidase